MSILLIGFMGAGKSTVGKALGKALNQPFRDLDQLVEENTGQTIPELFDQGEVVFRQAETAALHEALQMEQVIACGGGIVLQASNHALLAAHPHVVYLSAQPDALFTRIQEDGQNIRPLAEDKSSGELQAILNPRLPLYQTAATIEVDTTGKSPAVIAQEILERLSLS